jgi:hypothetical protein
MKMEPCTTSPLSVMNESGLFCRFVVHIGGEESFWAMKNENNLVWCPDYEEGR